MMCLTKSQRRLLKKRQQKLLKKRGYHVIYEVWLKKGNRFRYTTFFVTKELAEGCVSSLRSRGFDCFIHVVKL